MSVIWISIAVILLDQLTKIALQFSQLPEQVNIVEGWLALLITPGTPISTEQLTIALLDSSSWVLMVGMLTLHVLISRGSTTLQFASSRALIGIQLAAGGLISYAFDYILRGIVQSSIELYLFDAFTFKAGIADLALTSAFLLLLYLLLRGRSPLSKRLPLHQAATPRLNFSTLPRGIDNIHIDVQLSPEFCRKLNIVVHQLITSIIGSMKQKKPVPRPGSGLFSELEALFFTLHQEALHNAKSSGEPQRVDLLYIALYKHIHVETAHHVASQIRQIRESVLERHKRGITNQEEVRYVEKLLRRKGRIIATANETMLQGIIGRQQEKLRQDIEGILGRKVSFSLHAAVSPLLGSNSPENGHIQLSHYFLFERGRHSSNGFMQIDHVLSSALHDTLALMEDTAVEDVNGTTRHREYDINNKTAELLSQPSVLMRPSNITILFDQKWTAEKIRKSRKQGNWRKYHHYRSHKAFQQRLAEQVIMNLKRAGMMRWIVAVYEARDIIGRPDLHISPTALVKLLAESDSQKKLLQRAEELSQDTFTPELIDEVTRRRTSLSRQCDSLLQRHLLAFMRDFSRYRRDLLLLYIYHKAASEISLLREDKALQTSRANYSLYEFLLPEEKSGSQESIRSHIIIKADVRGSTEVTERLTQLALNPATHFDLNFFSPINQVINDYGAEKVFIEGDAMILIINDYGGAHKKELIASRACALAAGMLRVVAKQNKELIAYGLPPLELGIGIAYSDKPPHFLFDGDYKVTISPAINRGDRLSACTWSIRNWREEQQAPDAHVEVYQPSERMMGRGEKAQKALVYNLNGILIEPAVYEALQKELTPRQIPNPLENIQDSELFVIKVPGPGGKSGQLVIRKAPVRIYDPEYRYEECPVVEENYYYEVIHDRETLELLRKHPEEDPS